MIKETKQNKTQKFKIRAFATLTTTKNINKYHQL